MGDLNALLSNRSAQTGRLWVSGQEEVAQALSGSASPLGNVEVARLFGWTGSSPIPLSFEGRGVVMALMEADKGEGRDL